MKKLAVLFSLIFCYFSLSAYAESQTLVFATPIEAGKTNQLKKAVLRQGKEQALLFQNLGIATYDRWIQQLQGQDFLIHLVKGEDLVKSFELLKGKIKQEDRTARSLNQLYLETLGVDLEEKNFFAAINALSPMLQVDMEGEEDTLIKEYCFIYPLLPQKKDVVLKMYHEAFDKWWNPQVHEIYRQRGISKQQLWIQDNGDASFLVIYQEITGSVREARKKYLSSKEEELSKSRAMKYSEITGLSYEDLLPKLESLSDSEILD